MSETFEFEWDQEKARANVKKHSVSFEEAATAFDDKFTFIFDDETHLDDAPREILLGYSDRNRLVLVAFVERALKRIRLVSARLATPKEHKD